MTEHMSHLLRELLCKVVPAVLLRLLLLLLRPLLLRARCLRRAVLTELICAAAAQTCRFRWRAVMRSHSNSN